MKFRKKPVVIEAFQLAPAGEPVPEGWEDWCGMVNFFDWESDRDEGIAIPTLEGVMRADPGDWIIKGVAGEFYPCKPDIFAATYDNADAPVDMGEVSDGYHTFNELYDHRVRLFSTLMHAYPKRSWFSKLHHDGTAWDGWIIAGIDMPAGTVTYHLPVSEITHLPQGIELTKGKEWDGHTPAMVVDRLLSLRAEQWEGYDVCHVPPEGWKCTRKAGHEGPCAAVPVLPAHQQRVIDERAELEDRHGKLSIFLDAPLFQTLPEEDRALLNEQYIHMTYYLNVLTRRIDRF